MSELSQLEVLQILLCHPVLLLRFAQKILATWCPLRPALYKQYLQTKTPKIAWISFDLFVLPLALCGRRGAGAPVERGDGGAGEAGRAADDAAQHEWRRWRRRVQDRRPQRPRGRLLHRPPRARGALSQVGDIHTE